MGIEDVFTKGVPQDRIHEIYIWFSKLWNSIYGKGAWERNDYVWVLTFKVIK